MSRIGFDGRVVLVTGAGGGLGREYALEFARRGAQVVVNDIGVDSAGANPSRDMADKVVAEIRDAGGTAIASYDDVATRAGGAAAVGAAVTQFGRLDAVIVNAGLLSTAPFENMTDSQISQVHDSHLGQGYYVGQPAYREMMKQGYGRFVFMGSSVGMFGDAAQAAYGPAKAGLFSLSNIIALEGGRHGIISNVVLPNARSRMSEQVDTANLRAVPEIADAMARVDLSPLMEQLDPVYNAALVVYLASEACTETHGVFSSLAGRYTRCSVSLGRGWRDPAGKLPTAEDVAEHWSEITADQASGRPQFVLDEMRLLLNDLRSV